MNTENYIRYNSSSTNDAYLGIWGLVDYLTKGDLNYIIDMINTHLSVAGDSDKVFEAKLNNLWLPHEYSTQLRELVGKIMDPDRLLIQNLTESAEENIDGVGTTVRSYFGHGLESLINYGGTATVMLPINGIRVLKQIKGKHILDVCVNEIGILEYIKWQNLESRFDPETGDVERNVVTYSYHVDENSDVYLTVQCSSRLIDGYFGSLYENDTPSEPIKIIGETSIPIVGVQIPINDDVHFRGTPYLMALAVACGRLALNSANIDYLLETIMAPRLVYQGGSPIKKMNSKNWTGINIGMNDKLAYLEHSGGSLDIAVSQIDRYKDDINSMNPISTATENGTNKTAFEISLINSREVTTRTYLIDRMVNYFTKVIQMAEKYKIIEPQNDFSITRVNPETDQDAEVPNMNNESEKANK